MLMIIKSSKNGSELKLRAVPHKTEIWVILLEERVLPLMFLLLLQWNDYYLHWFNQYSYRAAEQGLIVYNSIRGSLTF